MHRLSETPHILCTRHVSKQQSEAYYNLNASTIHTDHLQCRCSVFHLQFLPRLYVDSTYKRGKNFRWKKFRQKSYSAKLNQFAFGAWDQFAVKFCNTVEKHSDLRTIGARNFVLRLRNILICVQSGQKVCPTPLFCVTVEENSDLCTIGPKSSPHSVILTCDLCTIQEEFLINDRT